MCVCVWRTVLHKHPTKSYLRKHWLNIFMMLKFHNVRVVFYRTFIRGRRGTHFQKVHLERWTGCDPGHLDSVWTSWIETSCPAWILRLCWVCAVRTTSSSSSLRLFIPPTPAHNYRAPPDPTHQNHTLMSNQTPPPCPLLETLQLLFLLQTTKMRGLQARRDVLQDGPGEPWKPPETKEVSVRGCLEKH